MIGSPWGPFFDQSLPGLKAKYDGTEVSDLDGSGFEENQHGLMDMPRAPHYLQFQNGFNADPVVMERDYSMYSSTDQSAARWQALIPHIWGTRNFSRIFGTVFLWFRDTSSAVSGRTLWKSPRDEFNRRWWLGTAWNHPAAYGSATDNGYWNGAGTGYSGSLSNVGSFTGVGGTSTVAWNVVWSLWYADSLPKPTDGAEEAFSHPTFNAFGLDDQGNIDLGSGTYPVYIAYRRLFTEALSETTGRTVVVAAENEVNADITNQVRVTSAVDFNRSVKMHLLTRAANDNPSPRTLTIKPWYRGL